MNAETYRKIKNLVDEQTYESEHQRNLAIHKYMIHVNAININVSNMPPELAQCLWG